jgi:hypothetical protein
VQIQCIGQTSYISILSWIKFEIDTICSSVNYAHSLYPSLHKSLVTSEGLRLQNCRTASEVIIPGQATAGSSYVVSTPRFGWTERRSSSGVVVLQVLSEKTSHDISVCSMLGSWAQVFACTCTAAVGVSESIVECGRSNGIQSSNHRNVGDTQDLACRG